MEPWSYELAGRFEEHAFESEVLKDNPLGDPHVRPLWVYLPPGYDENTERRYPSIYLIQGLTGQLDMWRNRSAFRRNFPELVDAMFADGESPPAVLVWVDAWTSLGGSQFVDSPGTGGSPASRCPRRMSGLARTLHRMLSVLGYSPVDVLGATGRCPRRRTAGSRASRAAATAR